MIYRNFGRINEFDERSRDFPISGLMGDAMPRTVVWACETWLDQGSDSSCVGCGVSHELAADPVKVPVSYAFAKNIYFEAQKIDSFPGGEYPGAECPSFGTSVLAGAKIAKRLGYIGGYYWSFNLTELIIGLQAGPAVLGLVWYEGMMQVDADGYIHPSGGVTGGHCILCRGVDMERRRFILRNSWGRAWGLEGDCYMSFEDMEKLLKLRGDACFFTGRRIPSGHKLSRWDRFLAWLRKIF